jgi:hypothetical protein
MSQMGDTLYMNCGDWVESCTALVERRDGAMELLEWREQGRCVKRVDARQPQPHHASQPEPHPEGLAA